jgi:hypothetical protein
LIERRRIDSRGQEVFPPKLKSGHYKQSRSLHLEHIPLEGGWGSETRCIDMDQLKCPPGSFDVPPQKDPEKLRQARANRREKRIALWDEFLRAFRFELVEPNHVHFKPTGTYKHRGSDDSAIFEKIEGDFWFDQTTNEISKMQYELIADVCNLVSKLYQGTGFTAELTKSIDNHYLPSVLSLRMSRRMLTSRGAEESEVRYFNYRKFETSVTFTFGNEVK